MDAFAVSICKGLSMKKLSIKKGLIIALYFGVFQGLMPLIGFFLGKGFENFVVSIDHWIAFILLSLIGINMIKEAIKEEEKQDDNVSFKTMIILAVATSIDALACRNNICLFKCKYNYSSNCNRRSNICNINLGSNNRKQIWRQIRKKSKNLRRYNSNNIRTKNPNRASIFLK